MIKLLIVDDESGLCEYLRDFFGPKGYQVSIATSAQEALAFVERETPELVLLDINMPDINGLEVLRYIKKTSAQSKVIMVTVSDDADTREKAKRLGADDFVKKPFTTDYLEDIVILKVAQLTKEKEPAHILIVDDEEGIRDTLKKFFSERFECELFEAGDGKHALDLLRAKKFDLVLLDIKMPGLSGMEVIRQLKKLDDKPCIWVITRFDSQEVAHKVIEQGADDYIPKPFSLRVLDSKIRDFLSKIGKYKPR